MSKIFITQYSKDKVDDFVYGLFDSLSLKPHLINSHMTKKKYDSSDFVAWVLLYGDDRELLKKDMDILNNVYLGNELINYKVFSVSGNGYGNGISLMFNLSL